MSQTPDFKKRLVMTTALAAAVFSYGRRAYAAVTCTPSPSPTYACSGSGAGGILLTTADTYAYVSGSLTISEPTLWGLELDAAGKQSFVDNVGAVISAADIGLGVRSSGDNGGSAGSVWIDSYANVTSYGSTAVRAENYGTGSINVTLTGTLSGGPSSYAVMTSNGSNGTSTDFTLGATGVVLGGNGIFTQNAGSGALNIDISGDITVDNVGVMGRGYGTDLYFTIEDSGSITTQFDRGVSLTNNGTGVTVLDIQGDIYAGTTGLLVRNNYGSSLSVTVGAGSHITSDTYDGVWALNKTSGAATMVIDGTVSAVTTGVYLASQGSADVTIGASAHITSSTSYGLDIENSGAGATDIKISGYVAGYNNGVLAYASGDGLTLHTYAGSTIYSSNGAAVTALNKTSGALEVTIGGDVSGKTAAVTARNEGAATTDLTFTLDQTGSVESLTSDGVLIYNGGTGITKALIYGDIDSVSGYSYGLSLKDTSYAGAMSVVTGQYSDINASGIGLDLHHDGAGGDLVISLNGSVKAGGDAIVAANNSGNLYLTAHQYSYIQSSTSFGINADNVGSGSLNITLESGAQIVTEDNGIDVHDAASADNMIISVAEGASIISNNHLGIGGDHSGSGLLSITVDGYVSGKSYALGAANISGSGFTLSTGKYSQLVSSDAGAIGVLNFNGDLYATLDGIVTGKTSGIGAISYASSDNLTIAVSEDAVISATDGIGVSATHKGSGAAAITVKGDIAGYSDGIYVLNYGSDVAVTTQGGSSVSGYNQTTTMPHDDGRGINIVNMGSGTVHLDIGGYVYGASGAIAVYNNASGGDVTIETQLGSDINSNNFGVRLDNYGTASGQITIGGDIHSTIGAVVGTASYGPLKIVTTADSHLYSSFAIYYGINLGNGILTFGQHQGVTINAGGYISAAWNGVYAVADNGNTNITLEDGSVTVADNAGVMVINNGSGSATVTVNGEITGDIGVDVTNNASAGDLTITTGADSKIAAMGSAFKSIGIRAYNYGTGATNVTLGGEVTATGDDAVHIVNYSDGGLYINALKGSKSSSTDFSGLFAANDSADGAMEVILDGEVSGSAGASVLAVNASNTAGMALSVGQTAYVYGSAVGLVVANGSAAVGTVQIDAGASIVGGLYGLLLAAPGTGTLVVDTSGDISGSNSAVQFGWSYFGGPLTGDVTLNIHGGQISGDVADYDPTGGHSIVNIVGDFTSEGNFDVSDFNVAKGTVFTLGKGYTVSASTDPIDIYGTFLIPEDPLITGDVDVHTDGLLDVQDITTITGFLKNDGTVSISHDATVTADTMQTGTGTLYFGVNSVSDHALLTIGSGAADLTGQTIKINVGTGATFTNSDQIKIIDGATTLIGGPSGATSVWDDSPAWEFNIVDGTGITDDSDLYLMLNASAPPPPIDGAIALATLTMADNAMNLTSERLSSVRSGRTGISAGGYYPAGSRRVWTQALGQLIHQGARQGISGYSARLMGASIGVDTDKYLGNGILGVSFNYGNSHIDSRNTFSTDTDIDSYQLTFYGDYNWPTGWYVNGMTAYAFNSNDTARHNADGAGATAAADFNSQQLGMRGEFGRVYNAGSGYFIPFAVADWTYYTAQNYTETGAGSANLHVESKDLHQADLGIGGKLGVTTALANDGVLEPEVHAVYRRDLLGNNLTTSQAYVSGGAPSFTVESPDPARDKFTLGTQVRYFSPDNLELSASYDVEFKEDYVSHTGLVRAGWKF